MAQDLENLPIEPSRPLPEGWLAYRDSATEKDYFYHLSTGETTWEHPDDHSWFTRTRIKMKEKTRKSDPNINIGESSGEKDDAPPDPRELPEGWTRYTAHGGKVAYYHAASRQTSYEHPNDLGFFRKSYIQVMEKKNEGIEVKEGGTRKEDTNYDRMSKAELESAVERLRAEHRSREESQSTVLGELQRRAEQIQQLEKELAEERAAITELQDSGHVIPQVVAKSEDSSADYQQTVSHEDEKAMRVATLRGKLMVRKADLMKVKRRRAIMDRLNSQMEELEPLVKEMKLRAEEAERLSHESGVIKSEKSGVKSEAGIDVGLAVLLAEKPWSKEALEKLRVYDEVFEWQAWSIFEHWSGLHLPHPLNQLGSPTTRQSLVTDIAITKVVDHHKIGLPGTSWEPIGGWRADMKGAPVDSEGWHYAQTIDQLVDHKGQDHQGGLEHKPERYLRRRRLQRLRMIVRVPGLIGTAKLFLQLAEKTAALEVMTAKLSDQVLDAQTKLLDLSHHAGLVGPAEQRLKDSEANLVKAKKQLEDMKRKIYGKQDSGAIEAILPRDEDVTEEKPDHGEKPNSRVVAPRTRGDDDDHDEGMSIALLQEQVGQRASRTEASSPPPPVKTNVLLDAFPLFAPQSQDDVTDMTSIYPPPPKMTPAIAMDDITCADTEEETRSGKVGNEEHHVADEKCEVTSSHENEPETTTEYTEELAKHDRAPQDSIDDVTSGDAGEMRGESGSAPKIEVAGVKLTLTDYDDL